MEQIQKQYEIGYLVRGEEGTGVVMDHLKRLPAEILFEGEVKATRLLYPIERLTSAYFGYIHFKSDPEVISNLNDALKLDNQVVRFLIVTPPFTKERSQRFSPTPPQPRKLAKPDTLPALKEATASNDLLEEKLEEILNK